jgi:hypothetical protein
VKLWDEMDFTDSVGEAGVGVVAGFGFGFGVADMSVKFVRVCDALFVDSRGIYEGIKNINK